MRKVKGCFTHHPHVPHICAGPLADFDLPVDSITKQCKGFAHVVYMMPEHAVKAFTELDGKTFMVRNCAHSQGVHGVGWEDVHGKELCMQSRRSWSWMGRRSW